MIWLKIGSFRRLKNPQIFREKKNIRDSIQKKTYPFLENSVDSLNVLGGTPQGF